MTFTKISHLLAPPAELAFGDLEAVFGHLTSALLWVNNSCLAMLTFNALGH